MARPASAERGTLSRREVREVGSIRGGEFQPRRGNGGNGRARRGLGIVAVLVAALLVIVFVLPAAFGAVARGLVEDNPDLLRLPFFADAVADGMDERTNRPAGTDDTPVTFSIAPGTSARQITEDLVQRGLVTDRLAFSYVLVTEGIGSRLRAGSYTLDRTMTPREVAAALQRQPDPSPSRVAVSFRFGLRLEQVTAQLVDDRERLGIDAEQFYSLATDPPDQLLADFPMLSSLPAGHSVEGFLGLGVFELDPGADAETLLRTLLARRQAEIGDLLDHPLPEQLDSFYQAIVLASIVEAEARVESERPLIAGVFLNRLDRELWSTRLLNADPTVIYGNDTLALREMPISQWDQFVFWSPPGRAMAEVFLPEDLFGYQTYRSRGLPPAPIRSPTISSIMGVLEPDADDRYLYFVAKADGSNEHAFARTFEEHLHNIEIYVHGRATPSP